MFPLTKEICQVRLSTGLAFMWSTFAAKANAQSFRERYDAHRVESRVTSSFASHSLTSLKIKNIVSFLLDFLKRNVHFMIANIPIYSTSKPYIILIGNAKQGVTEPTPRYGINSCMYGASNRSKHQEPVSLKSRNFSSPFRMPKFS